MEIEEMSETTAGTKRKIPIGIVLVLLILVLVLAVAPWRGLFSGGGSVNATQTITEPLTETVTVTENAQTGTSNQLLEYCFSPGADCASVVTKWIDRAKVSVHVLIYDFTLDRIGDAVVRAKNRGVDVRIVLEADNAKGSGSEYAYLKSSGVQIRLDTNPALMHDKIAIIDGLYVITGSFNWTNAANSNHNDNLVVLRDQTWAQAFEQQFTLIWSQATP
jgi:phosphatidylserine/phosphatidylglycerophosphate/cardiolipin synthase-like enzyme